MVRLSLARLHTLAAASCDASKKFPPYHTDESNGPFLASSHREMSLSISTGDVDPPWLAEAARGT